MPTGRGKRRGKRKGKAKGKRQPSHHGPGAVPTWQVRHNERQAAVLTWLGWHEQVPHVSLSRAVLAYAYEYVSAWDESWISTTGVRVTDNGFVAECVRHNHASLLRAVEPLPDAAVNQWSFVLPHAGYITPFGLTVGVVRESLRQRRRAVRAEALHKDGDIHLFTITLRAGRLALSATDPDRHMLGGGIVVYDLLDMRDDVGFSWTSRGVRLDLSLDAHSFRATMNGVEMTPAPFSSQRVQTRGWRPLLMLPLRYGPVTFVKFT